MYKADITSTTINKGLLTVEVLFYSNNDSFKDVFQTNQQQDESWLEDQIERKLNNLNSLIKIKESIVIGPYQKTEKVLDVEAKKYHEKTILYHNYMNTARTGIINYDRPVITELREWLRNNFKDEYLQQ